MAAKVIVIVEGGVVQQVYSSDPNILVDIYDLDDDPDREPDLEGVEQVF